MGAAMQSPIDFSHYLKNAGSGLLHLDLAVEGINCAGCMARIERNLSRIPDVTTARVNLTDRRLAQRVVVAGGRTASDLPMQFGYKGLRTDGCHL